MERLSEQKTNYNNMLWLNLKRLMLEKNISQAEIARRANFSTSLIPMIKRGKVKKPSFELICKLADALEVDINEFRKE